ncbi:hypothetical protein AVEN_52918-1 [Araneus ventricosus]|uniref:Uncharacterized protein n=1 Tax=Araneus ventricosus TaxID=182803 RepID=A0A4Y2FJ05_ARAVE|nr:hypothetical protein AVEN_52918-1 [Araneus ventricosus]
MDVFVLWSGCYRARNSKVLRVEKVFDLTATGSVRTCVPVLCSPVPVRPKELQPFAVFGCPKSRTCRHIFRTLRALLFELLQASFKSI